MRVPGGPAGGDGADTLFRGGGSAPMRVTPKRPKPEEDEQMADASAGPPPPPPPAPGFPEGLPAWQLRQASELQRLAQAQQQEAVAREDRALQQQHEALKAQMRAETTTAHFEGMAAGLREGTGNLYQLASQILQQVLWQPQADVVQHLRAYQQAHEREMAMIARRDELMSQNQLARETQATARIHELEQELMASHQSKQELAAAAHQAMQAATAATATLEQTAAASLQIQRIHEYLRDQATAEAHLRNAQSGAPVVTNISVTNQTIHQHYHAHNRPEDMNDGPEIVAAQRLEPPEVIGRDLAMNPKRGR